ncbi:Rv1733c family protein [Streptomyces sp. NPDC055025]
MRTLLGLWRWRRNPLRRATDLIEGWVALAAVGLFALAAPLVGWLCGNAVDASLRETVRFQHEHRHRTTAVVVGRSAERHVVAFDAESAAEHDTGGRVIATWRTADGGSRTGLVPAPSRAPRAGDTFGIWADERGRPVKPPMNADSARTHAVLAGLGAGVLAAGLVECGRRLIVWRLVRRRYEHLDRAWSKAGPDWGRTGAGG